MAISIIAVIAIGFAILLNGQKNLAKAAESRATILAQQKSELADRETAARKLADDQNQLSLTTLKSVVYDISRKLRNVPAASVVRQSLLKTAIDGLNRVAKTLDNRVELDHDLMIAHRDIGRIYLSAGSVDGTDSIAEALKHFQRANKICQKQVAVDPGNSAFLRDLSISYESIGDVQQQRGDLARAEEAYLKGLAISEKQILTAPGDHEFKRDVAYGFEKLGDIRMTLGNTKLAKEAIERSYNIYREIAEAEPNNVTYQRDFQVAQSKFGNVLLTEGNLPEAEKLFRAGVAMCEKLEKYPDSGAQLRDRSVALNKLGAVLQKRSMFVEAADAYGEGLAIAKKIATSDPNNTSAQRDLSISFNLLGDLALLQKNWDEARIQYGSSLKIRRGIAEKNPSNHVAQTDVAQSLYRLGDLEDVAGQPDKGDPYFKEALEMLTPLKAAGKLQSAIEQQLLELIETRLKLDPAE